MIRCLQSHPFRTACCTEAAELELLIWFNFLAVMGEERADEKRATNRIESVNMIAVVDDMMVLSHRMLESDWTEDDELVRAYMYLVYLIVT